MIAGHMESCSALKSSAPYSEIQSNIPDDILPPWATQSPTEQPSKVVPTASEWPQIKAGESFDWSMVPNGTEMPGWTLMQRWEHNSIWCRWKRVTMGSPEQQT